MPLAVAKLPGLDRARIAADVGRVLHEALRQPADRRSSEADQRIGIVGRVALEIAPQPAAAAACARLSSGRAKWSRPTGHSRARSGPARAASACASRSDGARERGRVDQSLVRLEPRHMRIAEQRDAAWRERMPRAQMLRRDLRRSGAAGRTSGRSSDRAMPASRSSVTAAATCRTAGCGRSLAAHAAKTPARRGSRA